MKKTIKESNLRMLIRKELKKRLVEGYEVHYSDGIAQGKKFNDLKKANQFVSDTIKNNKKLQHIEIFKTGSGFHSTTQDEFLVSWWGKGSYWDNVSKKNPELKKKQFNESTVGLNEETRPLYVIAQEILRDWHNVSPYAQPYLRAMLTLDSINDKYILDSGRSIVAYFLGNAQKWTGEKARAIKKELNDMLKHR